MAYKRVNKDGLTPIETYFRFKAAVPPNEKVKVWEPGMTVEGTYMKEIRRTTENGEFRDYMLIDSEGKGLTVPHTAGLERDLSVLPAGTPVRLTFVEKVRIKGNKTFRVIDVEADTDAAPEASEEDESTPL